MLNPIRIMRALVLLFLVGPLLSGCAPFVDADQPHISEQREVRLLPRNTVGQTFVAHHAGLHGIQIWLAPVEGNGTVTLHLRSTVDSPIDEATASLPGTTIAAPDFYTFSFEPLADSHDQSYYTFLEMEGEGSMRIGTAPFDSYQSGALYEMHRPADGQLAFRLTYHPFVMAWDLLGAALEGVGLLGITGLLFVVPGWTLLVWFWPESSRLSLPMKLGLAAGISLALYPLLFLWTDLVGLHLGPVYGWLPAVGGLAALIVRMRSLTLHNLRRRLLDWNRSPAFWPDMTLFVVLALVFGLRLLVVRTLPVPMWGDSYQHTMIAQLMVDHGGLFDSWRPYVPLKTFTYHFGFHSAVSVFHWLTRHGVVSSTIIVGQIINGLAVLALYPIATRLSSSRWGGVFAVLVAGLLSPMPMFYVNWGRYVQLAGQVIFPVVVWLVLEALDLRPPRVGALIVTGMAIAGLGLTHYRVAIYFFVFVVVILVAEGVAIARRKKAYQRFLLTIGGVGLVALLLVLPWLWHLRQGYLPTILGSFARSEVRASTPNQFATFRHTFEYLPPWLLAGAVVGLGIGLLRRGGTMVPLTIWVLALFAVANPNLLRLPGATTVSNFEGVLNNFTILISLYMVVSVLWGYLGSVLIARWEGWEAARWKRVLTVVALGLVMGFGVRQRLTVIDPFYQLVTAPDLRAMTWIRENTPETSKFLANSFFAYEDNVIVGSDAGWWIPLLAGRENTVPPITYGHEVAYEEDFIARINELAAQLEHSDFDASETAQLLVSNGVTHVYVGQKGGYIPVEQLQASDFYCTRYHQDGVWIFEIVGSSND